LLNQELKIRGGAALPARIADVWGTPPSRTQNL